MKVYEKAHQKGIQMAVPKVGPTGLTKDCKTVDLKVGEKVLKTADSMADLKVLIKVYLMALRKAETRDALMVGLKVSMKGS